MIKVYVVCWQAQDAPIHARRSRVIVQARAALARRTADARPVLHLASVVEVGSDEVHS